MPQVWEICLRCRGKGSGRTKMAQNVLQMWDVQQDVGLNELCRTRRRTFLQELSWTKIRTQGLRVRRRRWMSQYGSGRTIQIRRISVNSRTSAAKTSQTPQLSAAAGNQTPKKPHPVLVTSSLSLSKFDKNFKFGNRLEIITETINSDLQFKLFKLFKFLNSYRLPVYFLFDDYDDLRYFFWRVLKLQKQLTLSIISNQN